MGTIKGTKNSVTSAGSKRRIARWLPLSLIGMAALAGPAFAQTGIRPIAVVETSGMSKQTLYLMYPDGSQKLALYTAANLGKPAMSPTERKVAFMEGSCRCMIILSYDETATAVKVTGKVTVPDGADGAFSPDGTRIVHAHWMIGRTSLYSVSTGQSQVLFPDQGATSITWIDNNRFAYASFRTPDNMAEVIEVKIDAAGQIVGQSVAARDFAFEGVSAARTRNSLFAGFVSTKGGTAVVREISLGASDTLGDAQVLANPVVTGREPVTSPTDESLLYKVATNTDLNRLDFATGVTKTINRKARQADWRR